MITIVTLSITLIITLSIESYLLYAFLKREKKYKGIIKDQFEFLQGLSIVVRKSHDEIKELDNKGFFYDSNDEVSRFFNKLKFIQEELDNYMEDAFDEKEKPKQ